MAASICAILYCYYSYNEMLINALAVLMHKCASIIVVSPHFIDYFTLLVATFDVC